MAGIGFELRKLYSENNTSYQNIRAGLYSSIVSAGTWLITVATLITLDIFSKQYIDSAEERTLFMISLMHIFIFSQVFAGGIQHFINRYVSDCVFEKKYYELKSSYTGIMKITIVITYIAGVFFMENSTFPSYYKSAVVKLFVILTMTWITMAYVSIVQNYRYIALSYAVGSIISLVLGGYFFLETPLQAMKEFPPYSILLAFIIGIGVTFFMLSTYLLLVFKEGREGEFDFVRVGKKYSVLIMVGIFYTLGTWGHLFVHLYFGESYIVGGVFRVVPFYSSTIFYSFFITIPTLVYFYVFIETNFYTLYRNYYALLNCNGTYKKVENAKNLMNNELKKEIAYSMKLQFLISLAASLGAELIFSYLGITFYRLGLFKITNFSALCVTFISIFIVLLLYFDYKKQALRISIVFFITATLFEYITLLLGEEYAGFGFFIGSFVSVIYANQVLYYHLEKLSYETFYKQNFIDSKTPKTLLHLQKLLNKKGYLIVLGIAVLLFTGCSSYDSRGFNKKTGKNWHTMSKYDVNGMDVNNMGYEGYDKNGFNSQGWNVYTDSPHDYYGFDYSGVNKETGTEYDSRGFNKKNINKETGTEYDKNGFNKEGINKETGTESDKLGWNYYGLNLETNTYYDKNGVNREGIDKYGFKPNGVNIYTNTIYDGNGFNKKRIHNITKTLYDQRGFNRDRIHKKTETKYDLEGFNSDGINKETGTVYNKAGWTYYGLNRDTKTYYNNQGVTKGGVSKKGFDKAGYNSHTKSYYDWFGFDYKGIHKNTQTLYNERGFDKDSIHHITKTKFDTEGFDRNGVHRDTGTKYNSEGWTLYGLNKETQKYKDKNGFNKKGKFVGVDR